jgi:hypothetical protein
LAAKDAGKKQPKPAKSSRKAVRFAEHVEVVAKGEGPKMIETQTRKINLPARSKDQ